MSVLSIILHLALALAAVVVVGRLVGRVLRLAGQPPVVGEVIAGIMLGPSLLGVVWPEAYAFLLPPAIASWLGVIAEIGVVLYMFLVGLELDTSALRGQIRSTVTIACGAMAIRFALGAALGAYLYASMAPLGVTTLSFNLFMGIAMSIVAFPVLARILADTGLIRSALGLRALAVAAVADLAAWCVLAVVVGIVQARPGEALTVTLAAAGVVVVILGAIRPAFRRFVSRLGDRQPGIGAIAAVMAGLVSVAVAADQFGVHPIAAAFLFGAAVPHESTLARALTSSLERGVRVALLPAFFAYIGMKTAVGLVAGPSEWLTTGLIVIVATVGTFAATFVVARLAGRPAREATALGVLMNTRGLMELVVLNVGLELGVISPTLFAMMVLMAITTTMLTTPLLRGVLPRG